MNTDDSGAARTPPAAASSDANGAAVQWRNQHVSRAGKKRGRALAQSDGFEQKLPSGTFHQSAARHRKLYNGTSLTNPHKLSLADWIDLHLPRGTAASVARDDSVTVAFPGIGVSGIAGFMVDLVRHLDGKITAKVLVAPERNPDNAPSRGQDNVTVEQKLLEELRVAAREAIRRIEFVFDPQTGDLPLLGALLRHAGVFCFPQRWPEASGLLDRSRHELEQHLCAYEATFRLCANVATRLGGTAMDGSGTTPVTIIPSQFRLEHDEHGTLRLIISSGLSPINGDEVSSKLQIGIRTFFLSLRGSVSPLIIEWTAPVALPIRDVINNTAARLPDLSSASLRMGTHLELGLQSESDFRILRLLGTIDLAGIQPPRVVWPQNAIDWPLVELPPAESLPDLFLDTEFCTGRFEELIGAGSSDRSSVSPSAQLSPEASVWSGATGTCRDCAGPAGGLAEREMPRFMIRGSLLAGFSLWSLTGAGRETQIAPFQGDWYLEPSR